MEKKSGSEKKKERRGNAERGRKAAGLEGDGRREKVGGKREGKSEKGRKIEGERERER